MTMRVLKHDSNKHELENRYKIWWLSHLLLLSFELLGEVVGLLLESLWLREVLLVASHAAALRVAVSLVQHI